MIEAENLAVSLGKRPILLGLSLRARAGELTAIIGPNGSGKSTLVKAISGDLPYAGTVRINGRDCRELRPWQMAELRAVLPQAAALSFPFTVHEVVRLGLTAGAAGLSPQEAAHICERALEKVDLAGFGGRFYQELSGGEQQRVQLARVLCQAWQPVVGGEPRWLILDEPVSSLDIKHQLVIMEIAADFARRGGGVIAVLHDLNLTAMFADQVLVMDRGEAAACGTPRDVFDDGLLARVFGCDLKVGVRPAAGLPFVLPHSARASLLAG